jgi:hypothetical protein
LSLRGDLEFGVLNNVRTFKIVGTHGNGLGKILWFKGRMLWLKGDVFGCQVDSG